MGTIKRTFANNLTGAGKFDATQLDSNLPAANITNSSVTNVTALSPSLGSAIPSVVSDPPSPSLGDIWYNTTTGKLKNYGQTAAVWASGGNMNTTRRNMAGFGSQTSGVAVGGFIPPHSNATEEYNGSSWTSVNNLPVTKEAAMGGAGTLTAGLVGAGSGSDNGPAYSASSFKYDGTNWTSAGTMNQQGLGRRLTGTQTAALGMGGYVGGGHTSAVEEYNGTSWTTVASLPATAPTYLHGAGTSTAGVASVGSGPMAGTHYYNGSTWSTQESSGPPSGGFTGSGHQGNQTLFYTFGTSSTGKWDDTSWTNVATLSTSRSGGADTGNTTTALYAGGWMPGNTNVTEEFTAAFNATKSVTTS